MLNRIFRWLLLVMLLLPLAVSTAQDGSEDGPIVVSAAWARATAMGALPAAHDEMDMGVDDADDDDTAMATEEAADDADDDAVVATEEADDMAGAGNTEEAMDDAPGAPMPGMAGHAMGGVSAVYMTLENTGDSDERLVAAQVAEDLVGIVEIHETSVTDGVAQMRPLSDGLLIPAGESVALAPGGYHIMLMDLQTDLVYGSTLAVTLVFESGLELAFDAPVGEIVISEAWVRAAAGMAMDIDEDDAAEEDEADEDDGEDSGEGDMAMHGGGAVSAAYMVLENRGLFPDRLVRVESPAAAVIEIHETVVENNVASMRPLPEGLDLPPGEAVALEPGGYHIMLLDMQMTLEAGSTVPLLLTFESGAQALVEAEVRAPGEM